MNRKTKILTGVIVYLVVDRLAMFSLYRDEKKKNEKLTEANNYLFDVAGAAIRKLPIDQIPEMATDIEFYHIAAKER